MALVKSYATSTLLLRVVHHYFILNHAISIWTTYNFSQRAANERSFDVRWSLVAQAIPENDFQKCQSSGIASLRIYLCI